MAPKKTVKEYEGLLAEPMYRPTLLTAEDDSDRWFNQRAAKTDLLFQHFGIDPAADNSWHYLAIALAERHVPGFGPPPPKRGHPMDYDFAITLWMRVELLRRRDGLKVRAAVEKIAASKTYDKNVEALRTRYREAVKHQHLKPMFELLNRIADRIGPRAYIESLEAGLSDG
jgi:hypothetical protein